MIVCEELHINLSLLITSHMEIVIATVNTPTIIYFSQAIWLDK